MSETVDLSKARATLSQLVQRASSGETIVLSRHGWPVATLGPIVSSVGSISSATSATIDLSPPMTTQAEHIAAAPTHRPIPEPPTLEAQKAAQAARDKLLGGMNTKVRR